MPRPRRDDRGGRGKTPSRPRMLYSRATVVVRNCDKVLLVKHNRQKDWALPGGRIMAGEEPDRRAILEVAEETGLQIKSPRYVGRYAGGVASHQIYEADATGYPRPNRKELQDAIWWDGIAPLELQPHVNAILAIINSAKPADGDEDDG